MRFALLAFLLVVSPAQATVRDVAPPAGPGSGMYFLAAAPDGAAYLSWIEPDPAGGHALKVARLEHGRWSAPSTVARGANWFVNWADHPSVTVMPDGALAVHWLVNNEKKDGGYAYGLRIARSTDRGATWREVYAAGTALTAGYAGFLSFLPQSTELSAAYLMPPTDAHGADAGHGAEHRQTLRYVRLRADGGLISDVVVDEDTCSCCTTDVATSPDGPIVVYRDHTGETRDISVIRFRDGKWTAPRPVHRDGWKIAGCPTNGPVLAVSGRRVAVAWFTAADDQPRVKLAYSSDDAASFSAPLRIDGGNPVGWPGIAMLDDGSTAVTWLESMGEGVGEVRLRRAWPDGRVTDPITVARTASGRSAGIPQMVRVGNMLVVAWRTDRVQVATVDLASLPTSGESRVW